MRNLITIWLLAVLQHGYASEPIQPVPFVVEGIGWSMIASGADSTYFGRYITTYNDRLIFRRFDPTTGRLMEGAMYYEDDSWRIHTKWTDGEYVLAFDGCDPYGRQSGPTGEFRKCHYKDRWMQTRGLESPEGFGSACIPTPGSISGGGEKRLVGTFDTILDCAVEAKQKFPYATALERDPWPQIGWATNCYAYEGSSATIVPSDAAEKGNAACLLKANKLPGIMIAEGTSDNFVRISPQTDSFENCIEAGGLLLIADGGGISWHEDNKECRVYRKAWSVDSAQESSGWLSAFVPIDNRKEVIEEIAASIQPVPFVVEGIGYPMIASRVKSGDEWITTYNDKLIFRRFNPTTGALMEDVMRYDKGGNNWKLYTKWTAGEMVLAIYNCDPYGIQSGAYGDFKKCSWMHKWMLTRGLDSPEGFGSACIPTPGSISGGGEKRLVGVFDAMLDCVAEARKKFPNATALERDPWPETGYQTNCYAYEGSSATIVPSGSADTWRDKSACLLKANKLPGMMVPVGTSDNFVRISPQTDSFENCIAAGRPLLIADGGGISWHEDNKECRVYRKAWSVDSAQESSGWLSAFVPNDLPGECHRRVPTDGL